MFRAPDRRRHLGGAILAAAAALVAGSADSRAAPPADNGAVVILYHRFGESRSPSSNIRLEQFEAHIAALELGYGGFAEAHQLAQRFLAKAALAPPVANMVFHEESLLAPKVSNLETLPQRL